MRENQRPLGAPAGVEPSRRLYLDLDGVMADFDAHFPATFGLDHRSMADDAMWETINSHPSYFRDMPPMDGAITFFRSIESLRPIVLTACPKSNYANAASQKRAWVREHLAPHVTVLPVMGGRHKPLFMQEPGDVLIDDWNKNIEAWREADGIGILHTDFATTSAILNEIFRNVFPSPTFHIGDRVEKVSGYRWPGVVRSIFTTEAGAVRLVVECTVPEVRGALHIYSPEQLRRVEEGTSR